MLANMLTSCLLTQELPVFQEQFHFLLPTHGVPDNMSKADKFCGREYQVYDIILLRQYLVSKAQIFEEIAFRNEEIISKNNSKKSRQTTRMK